MRVRTTISEATANRVLADVCKVFDVSEEDALDGYGPVLWQDDPYGWGCGSWGIAWEDGPEEWTLTYATRDSTQQQDDGVFVEPVRSWLLGIYSVWEA